MQTTSKPNIDRTFGHIDLSTGADSPHVVRKFTLRTDVDGKRRSWDFTLSLPRTIDDALDTADWQLVMDGLEKRREGQLMSIFEAIIVSAKLLGVGSSVVTAKVTETVSDNLYRIFCARQGRIGNKAWLVPPSMQKASDPNE